MSMNLPPTPGGGPSAEMTPGGAPVGAPVQAEGAPVAAGQTQSTSEPGMDTKGTSVWKDAFQRLKRNPAAIAGAVIVVLFFLVAILAPVLAPYPGEAVPGAREITPGNIPGPGEIGTFPLGLDLSLIHI